jgi:hypothetical protein
MCRDHSRFRKTYAMQYRFEEVSSEQRFMDNTSPLPARNNPFVCSRVRPKYLMRISVPPANARCNNKAYHDVNERTDWKWPNGQRVAITSNKWARSSKRILTIR